MSIYFLYFSEILYFFSIRRTHLWNILDLSNDKNAYQPEGFAVTATKRGRRLRIR